VIELGGQADAERATAEVEAPGRRSLAVGGDLTDPAAVERICDGVVAQLGRLDLFIGIAGIWPPEEVPVRDMADARWRTTMAADLDAVFLTTRAALRVDTEMVAGALAGEARARIAETIPLGRVASPDDIAGPIVFRCSGLARHSTDEVLNVNGGSVLWG
jgi:NAD(P)-dependent dehydrogenase (short-subunit alcohol dehydrogenase family)